MLEIFRRNRFFNSLLLLPYTVLVRVWLVFDGSAPPIIDKGVLSDWVIGGIDPEGGLALAISILLVYFQAILLNRLVIRNRLTHELTLFPGLFYILLVSFFPQYNGLSAPLVANTFVILGLGYLMATHKSKGNSSRIFTGAFWFGIAFLFYFGYILLFFVGVLGLSMLRSVKAREWLQFTIGFFTPYFVVSMLDYLLHSNLADSISHWRDQFGVLDFDVPFGLPLYMQIGLFGFLGLIFTFNYASFTLRKNIHVQKKINFLFTLLVLSVAVAFLQSKIYYEDWLVLCIPSACFISLMFVRSKQLLILEVIHFLMLLAVLGLQIYTLL